MRVNIDNWISSRSRAYAARHWGGLVSRLRNGGQLNDNTIREEAKKLRNQLSSLLQLSSPEVMRDYGNLSALPLPPGTDWRWRPAIFSGKVIPSGICQPEGGEQLGEGLAIWHDCRHHALTVRQCLNNRADDDVPFGLCIEAFGFAGSYASLSVELPEVVLEELGRHHIFRVQTIVQAEAPVKAYGRVNLLQGPNVEKIVREIAGGEVSERDMRIIEFDLSFADLSPTPIRKVWVDLIFYSPFMNSISVNDIVVSRHPRVEV